MTYAYVLIKSDQGKQNDALAKISKMKGVETAHTVTGPYDIVAYVAAEDMASLGRTVISKIQNLNMIKDTMTCIVLDLL
ncbi:MAG: Lrp/AsnC ligand binding domain-containing protein [Actinomycetia bacterium]|nr:Lrp/AsnC ligand binding domain-containing protein [Actinomycetes bacterium]